MKCEVTKHIEKITKRLLQQNDIHSEEFMNDFQLLIYLCFHDNHIEVWRNDDAPSFLDDLKTEQENLIYRFLYHVFLVYWVNDNKAKNDEGKKWLDENWENIGIILYFTARGVQGQKPNPKAVEALLQESNQNNPQATAILAHCYLYGQGVEKDGVKAVKLYQQAVEQENLDAIFYLGQCYEYGWDIEQNAEQAFKLYKKAAELGYVRAYTTLADQYKNGYGVEKNHQEAYKWYSEAVAKGIDSAQFNALEAYFLSGVGYEFITQNELEAQNQYNKEYRDDMGYTMKHNGEDETLYELFILHVTKDLMSFNFKKYNSFGIHHCSPLEDFYDYYDNTKKIYLYPGVQIDWFLAGLNKEYWNQVQGVNKEVQDAIDYYVNERLMLAALTKLEMMLVRNKIPPEIREHIYGFIYPSNLYLSDEFTIRHKHFLMAIKDATHELVYECQQQQIQIEALQQQLNELRQQRSTEPSLMVMGAPSNSKGAGNPSSFFPLTQSDNKRPRDEESSNYKRHCPTGCG